MDIATIIGLFLALGLIVLAMVLGDSGIDLGGILLFVDPKSALIVVGGTLGASLINYPLGVVIGAMGVAKNTVFTKTEDVDPLIKNLVDYAGKARRDGILVLQSVTTADTDPFLGKGIQLAVDGMEPQFIAQIMETEIEYIEDRHKKGADFFNTLGALAPAFGLIGTLIGLVMMLQNMDDPSSIGPAMAVALITTFYGALMANVFFIPMAGKLKTRSDEELLVKEIMKEGILSIAAGDNPRILESKLHSFLEPKRRKSAFDEGE